MLECDNYYYQLHIHYQKNLWQYQLDSRIVHFLNLPNPCRDECTIRFKLLNTIIANIHYVHIILRINGNADITLQQSHMTVSASRLNMSIMVGYMELKSEEEALT